MSATRRWRVAGWVGLLALLWALIPEAPGRRMTDADLQTVWLVDHGYHVGLILPRADLAGAPFLPDFPAAPWFEIGWGDEGFYTQAAEIGDVSAGLAASALLYPTPSVLHVVALYQPPETAFDPARMARLRIDAEGRATLRDAVLSETAEPLVRLGRGLYGDSAFYRARSSYHLFDVCNHWLSRALNRAGLPSSELWSTLPIGLIEELRLRGGADGVDEVNGVDR